MKSTLAVPITSAFILLSLPVFSQAYKTAAGVRFDNGFNITLQQFLQDGWTVEGILHTPILSRDFGATILGEKHHKIIARGTNFYTGAGVHYYWNANANQNTSLVKHNVFGFTGIAGIEFSMGRLNLSVDWKPELHLAGDQSHPFDWNGAAISARYIIEKRERKKIKDWKIWDKVKKYKA
ncbi:MAG: hypothetical protein RIQ78_469 [Bacteroidota bacterium]|jgi:hypothetical protein